MNILKITLVSLSLSLVSVMAQAGVDTCKTKYQDCKIKAFSDSNTCRLKYDECKMNQLMKNANSPSTGKIKSKDI